MDAYRSTGSDRFVFTVFLQRDTHLIPITDFTSLEKGYKIELTVADCLQGEYDVHISHWCSAFVNSHNDGPVHFGVATVRLLILLPAVTSSLLETVC